MIDLALRVLLIGLAGAGLGALARALPWPKTWLKRKPLNCGVCVPGHGVWISMLIWQGVTHWTSSPRYAVIVYFAALGVAAYAYRAVFPPEPEF